MADIDLTTLQRLAEAATKGEWRSHRRRWAPGGEWPAWVIVGEDEDHEQIVAECEPANAAFIAAASPSVVLALLARLREREEEIARAKERADSALCMAVEGPDAIGSGAACREIARILAEAT